MQPPNPTQTHIHTHTHTDTHTHTFMHIHTHTQREIERIYGDDTVDLIYSMVSLIVSLDYHMSLIRTVFLGHMS